ncbi:hypothetical protein GJW-30_1_04211 [Variibacter gotjawalensis]|uniref:DUF4189 domain-containing protein n=1 Tax=Variibacter gotjawalensis TaxID=1333996 RepID=A0A0S3Q0H2_9BRAD|nr:DUF4189 domain-containing protein [Variibacter gotjawalensis]NIK47492.1 hypothetical protein [Variibacter gotjawalensis]RZS49388.1 uncharacterized protein DUF4189 [Variibacter gotjawalensis]BAT61651.1 hypothetical protein GJW-30_1_04211 [Variibacter gotjawalensis]
MKLWELAAIAIALSCMMTPQAQAAYAIAFNSSTGRAAADNSSFALDQVRKAALSKCGSGCRIVSSGKGSCAAVVEAVSTGTFAWGVSTGTTTGSATNAATHECRRKGGVQCKPAAAICD